MRLLTIAAVLLLSAAARADGLRLAVSDDPREETPFRVTVSGATSSPADVNVGWADGRECDIATSYPDVLYYEAAGGDFSVDAIVSVPDAGPRVLCASLEPSDDELPARTIETTVLVRANRAELRLSARTVLPIRRSTRVHADGATELGREIEIEVVPGTTCGTHPQGYAVSAFQVGEDVEAGPFSLVFPMQIRAYGRYVLCGYVVEGADFLAESAEVIATQPLLVTPPCSRAWPTVARARRRLAAARAVLDRAWHAWPSYRMRVRAAERSLRRARRIRARRCPRGFTTASGAAGAAPGPPERG